MNDHWLETYKSLISISMEGFKLSALMNGGAAVAMLAYLGNIAGKGASVPDMRCPMAAFLAGLLFCSLSMLFAYLTQLKLLNEIGKVETANLRHSFLLWIAILLFALSLAMFGIGGWQAVLRF